MMTKKLNNEAALLNAAITAGIHYAETRGAIAFNTTDSPAKKILDLYRLLVRDKLIQPLPDAHVSQKAMRRTLAMWMLDQLPEGHPLLN